MIKDQTSQFSSLHEYKGQGTIRMVGQTEVHVDFTFNEEQNGRLQLQCALPADFIGIDNYHGGSFDGRTIDGFQLELPQLFLSSHSLWGGTAHFDSLEATLTPLDGESNAIKGTPHSARVPLTNCWFSPEVNEVHEFSNGFKVRGQQIPTRLGTQEITICYRFPPTINIDDLKAKQGIGVLSDALMPLSQWPVEDDFRGMIAILCSLLTFICDTHVGWVGYDVYDKEKRLLKRRCFANPTRGYTGHIGGQEWAAIIWIESVPDFLEQAYARYNQLWDDWDIYSIINLFNDVRGKHDYLESSGLQLTTCVEIMNAQHLGRTGGEYILPEKQFDKKLKPLLKKPIEEMFETAIHALSSKAEEGEDIQGELDKLNAQKKFLLENLTGINRSQFRKTFEEICERANFAHSTEAIARFKRNRDRLTHDGLFAVIPAREYKQKPARRKWDLFDAHAEERAAELRFMTDFVGTLILCALGVRKRLENEEITSIESGVFEIDAQRSYQPKNSTDNYLQFFQLPEIQKQERRIADHTQALQYLWGVLRDYESLHPQTRQGTYTKEERNFIRGVEREIQRRSALRNASAAPNLIIGQVGDRYISEGQVGSMGANAQANNNTLQQIWTHREGAADLKVLADELAKLRRAMRVEAEETEQDMAVTEIGLAEQAVRGGENEKAQKHMKSAGKWACEIAAKIGADIAAQSITRSLSA